jgi:hypothetical protein
MYGKDDMCGLRKSPTMDHASASVNTGVARKGRSGLCTREGIGGLLDSSLLSRPGA